ncbi:MAG: Ig-like domain-containing protein [Bacillota bacterium]|nr:Ig-like domain-containing protein [Bacillota bacterium]
MKKTKLLAIVMAVVMVFAMAPCVAFASPEEAAQDGPLYWGESASPDESSDFDYSAGSMLAEDPDVTYIPIKINFGAKHKAMAKKFYSYVKSSMEDTPSNMLKPRISGAVVTAGVEDGMSISTLSRAMPNIMMNLGYQIDEYHWVRDAGEVFNGAVVDKPVNKFKSFYEFFNYYMQYSYPKEKPLEKNKTYYIHWYKPFKADADIQVAEPVCGTEVYFDNVNGAEINGPEAAFPADQHIVTSGVERFTCWEQDGYNFHGAIQGGKKYTASISLTAEFGYIFEMDSNFTINGAPAEVSSPMMAGHYFTVNSEMTALHAWDRGQSSDTSGTVLYQCANCSETYEAESAPVGEDGTPVGKDASFIAVDDAIKNMNTDEDPLGTVFAPIKVRSTVQDKQSVTLKWESLPGAKTYLIYGNKCGSENHMELITETDQKTGFQIKGLPKGTYHKFIVAALNGSNRVIATSRMIHVATKGGKVGNYKNVTIKVKKGKKFKKATSATVAAGKTLKTKVTAAKASKKLKVKKHVGTRYESSDEAVATVTAGGVITGVSPGKCTITAYAQNGVFKVLKLTVK